MTARAKRNASSTMNSSDKIELGTDCYSFRNTTDTRPGAHPAFHFKLTAAPRAGYGNLMSRWESLFRSAIAERRPGLGCTLVRGAGFAASIPYRWGVAIRNRRYDRDPSRATRVSAPVISIGNLTLGGTGKTPAVEYFARTLRDQDLRVAVLSRGYGRDSGPNDEALLIEQNLPDVPVLVDPDRIGSALMGIEELESEIFLLDDGFQHRRLHRDLDIVLIDAARDFRNEKLFPGGTLRESVSGLKRAQVAILTRADRCSRNLLNGQLVELRRRFPHLILATARHSPMEWIRADADPLAAESIHGRSVLAFCGIAQPNAFRETLVELGADIRDLRTFGDHHNYTLVDVESLTAWAAASPADSVLVTTQKDWVKLGVPDLGGRPLLGLRIGFEFLTGEAECLAQLAAVLPQRVDA